MSAKHIFVVDDDDVTAAILSGHLTKEGYRVTRLADGNTLIDDVQREQPDAIILDGRLPSADGFDELLGLELGADDYLRKPATSRIVLAHLRACLRRTGGAAANDGKASLAFGDLHINPAARSATLKGEAIPLTTAEFDLLWMLASQSGSVLSREEMFRQTRGIDYDGLDRSIDMRISRLRKLIGDDTENPVIIKTVRGKGYLFVAPT
jgi:DNA-binding response OmpR family regulator